MVKYLRVYRLSESVSELDIKYQVFVIHLLFSRSVSGQTLTLRRDSSMADRRALSLSFFKKPCGQNKDRARAISLKEEKQADTNCT